MSRRRLSALALLALLAATAWGGELRVSVWPANYVPMVLTNVRVVMDVGYWINFVTTPDVIKLQQIGVSTYQGHTDIKVNCNFDLSMCSTITPTGEIPGQYSSWIDGGEINAPQGRARLYARLEKADIAAKRGGSRDIHVATVTIRITPRV